MKYFTSALTLGTLLASGAGASPVISAQSIIVNPVQTSLSVRVWTDRDSSGSQVPNYAPGERIRLYTSVNQDAYVYLFNVDPQGNVDLILPNKYQGGANFLKANTTRTFPAANDPFTFDIAAPYGVNKVLALASLKLLNLGEIATFKTQQNSFAAVRVQGQQQLAQALSIVVSPVDQQSWISDTALYNVAAAGAQAAPLQTPAPTTSSATSAPSTSTPTRGTPIQPVPNSSSASTSNASTPTASALSVTVKPAAPQPAPLPGGREWQTSFERRGSLSSAYNEYAARLRAEGYTQVSSKAAGNHIRGEFRKGSSRATLEVKQKGSRFEVKLSRR